MSFTNMESILACLLGKGSFTWLHLSPMMMVVPSFLGQATKTIWTKGLAGATSLFSKFWHQHTVCHGLLTRLLIPQGVGSDLHPRQVACPKASGGVSSSEQQNPKKFGRGSEERSPNL